MSDLMRKLLILFRASRPLTTWPSGLLLFAIGLHVAEAQPGLLALANILVLPLFAIIAFGINDIYDYDTDRAGGRKSSLAEGTLLEPKHRKLVKKASLYSAAILVAFSALTRNYTHFLATLALIAIGYAYSAPPFRLKAKPIIDSLSNALAAMSVILLGFSYGGTIFEIPAKVIYASFAIAGLHSVGAAMDYTADKKAGISTIATFFGKRFAAAFSFAIIAAILLFSGIKSIALNLYLWLWLLVSGVAFAHPDEKAIRKMVVGSFLFAVAAMTLFLYQQFYK